MYPLALNRLNKDETVGDNLQNLLAMPLSVSPTGIQRDSCDSSRESAEARAHRCLVQTNRTSPLVCVLFSWTLKEVGCLKVA